MPNDVEILLGIRPGANTCLYGDNSTYEQECCLARPLVGRGFKPQRADSRCADYIVLALVDLANMWLSINVARAPNLQQEPGVYKKWPEPVHQKNYFPSPRR